MHAPTGRQRTQSYKADVSAQAPDIPVDKADVNAYYKFAGKNVASDVHDAAVALPPEGALTWAFPTLAIADYMGARDGGSTRSVSNLLAHEALTRRKLLSKRERKLS